MNEDDLKLRLLVGMPIPIEKAGDMYIPSLKKIISVGESNYNQFLSVLLLNKDNIDGLVERDDLTNFHVATYFCYHDLKFKDSFLNALSFFFKSDVCFEYSDTIAYFDLGNKNRIDESNFNKVQWILGKANYVSNEKEYKPANSKAREMIDMIRKSKKTRPKPKELMNLHSIISGLAWKSKNLNITNIMDISIYQLYNGFYTIENIDNYHHTLSGLYAGTIDGKSIKFDQIHWAKIIDK